MSIGWVWVLLLIGVLGDAGRYLLAPPEKKAVAGAQALASSLALLGSACLMLVIVTKLIPSGRSVSGGLVAGLILLMLLVGVLTYLAIAATTWRLFERFLRKRN